MAIRDVVLRVKVNSGEAATGARAIGGALTGVTAKLATVNAGFQKMVASIKGAASGLFSLKTLIAGLVVGKIGSFFKSAIDELAGQEKAERKLQQALLTTGQYSRATMEDLKNLSSALQETTIYADDASLEMMALLGTFGMSGDEIKKSTRVVQDMASALDIDLITAAQLVGRAFAGQTGTLSRYGIVLDQDKVKAGGFAYVLDALEKRFNGMSEAVGNTAYGAMQKLSNQWGDMKEEIASVLVETGAFENIMNAIKGLMTSFRDSLINNPDFLVNIFNAAVQIIQKLIELLPTLMDMLAKIVEYIEPLLKLLGMFKGGAVGASIGGAIGSVIPGIGTAIGSVAGAVIGAGAGYAASDWLTSPSDKTAKTVNIENNFNISGVSGQQVGRAIDKGKTEVVRQLSRPIDEMAVIQRNQRNYDRYVTGGLY